MARRARCGWVRSVLTQEVKAIAAASPRIDAACPKLTSGQLPFLGSAAPALAPQPQTRQQAGQHAQAQAVEGGHRGNGGRWRRC